MTFKQIWTAVRTTWQSRPLAILLPIGALVVYWLKHGHTFTASSFPNWGEWVAGSMLLATKFERLTEFLFGAPAPASLPAPVASPALVPPPDAGGPGKVAVFLAAFIGLSLGLSSCATVQPIVKDVEACAGPAWADAATKIIPAVEVVLECDAAAGFSPSALPACASAGLEALASALGPDGWRIVGCITNAIERDMTTPEPLRLRASAARKLAAVKAHGR